MNYQTSGSSTRRIYWGLLLCPWLSITIGCACGWIAFQTHGFVRLLFAPLGLIGVIAGIVMIRVNIARGWGWHGQGPQRD